MESDNSQTLNNNYVQTKTTSAELELNCIFLTELCQYDAVIGHESFFVLLLVVLLIAVPQKLHATIVFENIGHSETLYSEDGLGLIVSTDSFCTSLM